ncbi:MAG: type II secretion system F family protein [Akkermansiaceae bacterium]
MALYSYQASDYNGQLRRGQLNAETLEEALAQITGSGLVPLDLKKAGEKEGDVLSRLKTHYLPVPAMELIVFTKQLATMIRVGIPMTQAFAILADQTEQPRLRRLAGIIQKDIEAGMSLSGAAGKHPKVFSPMFCSMIEAGETSGTLPEVLDRLLFLTEHEAKVKAEIKTAFRYPLMVVGTLAVAFLIMIGFVIPRFVSFFTAQNLDLPLPTRICITMSDFLSNHGIAFFLGILVFAFCCHRFFNRTERGLMIRDRSMLGLPLVGPILIKASMSRFASILALLQSSGVLILDSLRILSTAMGNVAISAEFDKIREMLEEGRGISGPLSSCKYFPPMLVNMVRIGERSGRLDEMLNHVAEHYDQETSHKIKKMTDSIGPILIISLTAVVGFFALAIYMPMWELTQLAGKKI